MTPTAPMGCPLQKDLFLSQNSSLYPNEFVEALFALSSYFRGRVCLGLEVQFKTNYYQFMK